MTGRTTPAAPKWYAIFPVLPIVLLIIFSKLVVTSIKLDTISALFMVWVGVVIVEIIRTKSVKKVFKDAMAMFQSMGKMFAGIVALIICAEFFATGLKVTQANLLLEQIMSAPKTTNVLIPNQHIGAYHVGFMGEWLSREYLARHNGFVREKHLVPARCPLFGYALDEMKLDGQFIRQTFLRPETQSKLGNAGYDAGAKILTDFFKEQLQQFVSDDLDPLGREIIDCCLHDGTLDDYLQLTPIKLK